MKMKYHLFFDGEWKIKREGSKRAAMVFSKLLEARRWAKHFDRNYIFHPKKEMNHE